MSAGNESPSLLASVYQTEQYTQESAAGLGPCVRQIAGSHCHDGDGDGDSGLQRHSGGPSILRLPALGGPPAVRDGCGLGGATQSPIRLLFVVPDLGIGGAERQLVTLLTRIDRERFAPSVICIGDEGEFFEELLTADIPARALYMGKRDSLRVLYELASVMRAQNTDVLIARGYSAEVLGRVAARVVGVRHSIVWAHNIGDIRQRGWMRRVADRLLDHWTTGYFGVAEAQRNFLINERHYPAEKIRILHNGIATEKFDRPADQQLRAEFGISPDDPVVGIVAVLRPEKDHATFLRAARMVVDAMPQAKFLIVGEGPTRVQLQNLTAALDLCTNVVFTGSRRDVDRILSSIDVFVLSSRTVECFPIAVLEAMAAGLPTVSTDVGGVHEMVVDGVTGFLVPRSDPRRLADRMLHLLSDPDAAHRMGCAARSKVRSEFDLRRTVPAAETMIEEVVGVGRGRRLSLIR